MTTITSNLYSTKAFSEHPIALWSLDEDVSFLSLISDQDRDFINWGQLNNASAVTASTVPGAPFEDSIFSTITILSASSGPAEAFSETIFNPINLSEYQENFGLSFFINTNCTDVDHYEFGYRYFDNFAGNWVEEILESYDRRFNAWIRLSGTFTPPREDTSAQIIFRVYANDGSIDYDFTMNGLAVGQWSETTSYLSLGAESASTVLNYDGIPAFEYGLQESSGYYFVEDGRLLAINEGIPLVFGSQNSTKIIPSASANPSLAVPGYGFLHEDGKYKNYTIEFWARLNPETLESRRIFGPLDTDNGIYVRDGVISLVIGDSIGSHPVSDWYRPMLIQVVIRNDTASMIVNGEKVFDIDYDVENIVFGQTNNWLGFYSYSDITKFEIDSVSIYSYPMAVEVAKRRFVWGQGTSAPQNISNSFKGKNAYINFSNAKYTVNKTYPDSNLWSSGYYDNLVATRTSLSSPNYSLPEIFIGEKTISELYKDNKIVNELENDKFFTFRPHVSASSYISEGTKWTEPSFLFFESLNFIDRLSSIYGIFSINITSLNQPLMMFKNSTTSDNMSIYFNDGKIIYKFNNNILFEQDGAINGGDSFTTSFDNNIDGGDSLTNLFNENIDGGDSFNASYVKIAAGININDFSNNFGYDVKRFFSSLSNLQLYIGGNQTETFIDKIYSVVFSNRKNYSEISSFFLENGIVNSKENQQLENHYGTYSLVPIIRYNRFFLDISISAQWEEYFPLSTFAGYVNDFNGKQYYDIDYLQINMGYPSITERVQQTTENFGWIYSQLKEEYSIPIQKSYEALDNSILTGYENYNDLRFNNITTYVLNTEKSSLRAYITFQSLFDGANKTLSEFPYTKDTTDCCFIDAQEENTITEPYRAYQTKFEFVDDVIVYPPKNIDFKEIAVVIHFDIKQKGIISNPIKVRDLEIASRAVNKNTVTPIQTESGIPLYPYVKSGIYLDYKEKNPIKISKSRYPYLHLTDNSGIKVLGRYTNDKEYGVAMPVNQEQKSSLRVGSFQLWAKYEFPEFSFVPYEIFNIESRTRNVEFVVVADSSGKRGVVYARDKITKIIEERLTFYQNGIPVKNPIIEIGQWNAIGIEFDDPLEFNNFIGYINLYRGMIYNNIAYYEASGLGERISTSQRIWLRILTEDSNGNLTWAYWEVDPTTLADRSWRDLAVISERRVFDLTQTDIYNAFAGTNRIIVDDGTSLSIDSDQLTIISNASWTRFSGKPA